MASIDDLYGMPKRKPLTLLDMLYGAGEMAAQLGTGTLAQLGSGLAYLPAAAMGGDKAGQAVMNRVSDAFTYQPTGAAATMANQKIGDIVAPIAKSGSVGAQTFADNVYNATGSAVLGAAARTAPSAIDLLADRLRIGGMGRPARNEITAYHGTPHDFDQFDMSNVGAGEGAQSYGHGLYFAESPDVARQYMHDLSRPVVTSSSREARAVERELDRIEQEYGEGALNRDVVEDHFRRMQEPYSPTEDIGNAFFDMLESGDIKFKSNLYTVDIPDKHVANFLDWDKPLSQQPQMVRGALTEIIDSAAKSFPQIKAIGDLTGERIYNAYKAHIGGDQAAASEAFASVGIPGIRYLDEGSRGKGKGTSNFVVFDDKLIKILDKK